MESYEYYLKGMNCFKSKYLISNQETDFRASVKMLERSLQVDPMYALAHVGLAWVYIHHLIYTENRDDFEIFRDHGETAYRLDLSLAETNAIKGVICQFTDNNKAFKFFGKAMAINPNISAINFEIGVAYRHLGLFHHAIEYFTRARELDPFYILSLDGPGGCFFSLGQFEEAVTYFEKVFVMNSNEPSASKYCALLGIMLKRYDMTDEILAKWANINPDVPWVRNTRALLFAVLRGNCEPAEEAI